MHASSLGKFILYTLDEFHHGGATTFVQQYTSVAHQLKYRTIIVGYSGDMIHPQKFFPHSKVIVVPYPIQWGIWGRIMNTFHYVQTLNTIYRSYPIAVIHLSTLWSSLAAYCHFMTWNKKRVITFYGLHSLEILSLGMIKIRLKKYVFKHVYHLMQFFILWATPAVVTFSIYAKKQLNSSFGSLISDKTTIIPGFILTMPPERHLQRKNKNLRLINFGRAEPRKGIEVLLEAIHKTNKRGIFYEVVIASPAQYYQDYSILKAYEKLNLFTQVQFLHVLSAQQKTALLQQSDVFTLPSQDLETFGMTTIESLSHGVPVIGTPIGATPEILGKIDNRLLCRDATSDGISEKLVWFATLTPKERSKMSTKAKEAVIRYHLMDRYKKPLMALYES